MESGLKSCLNGLHLWISCTHPREGAQERHHQQDAGCPHVDGRRLVRIAVQELRCRVYQCPASPSASRQGTDMSSHTNVARQAAADLLVPIFGKRQRAQPSTSWEIEP